MNLAKIDRRVEALAISKAIPTDTLKQARKQVKPGHYDIDVTVRVHGTIKVGEPYETLRPQSVPWELIARAAIDRLSGPARKVVMRLVHEAQVTGTVRETTLDVAEDQKTEVAAWLDALAEATLIECNGRTDARLAVDLVA